MAFTFAVGVLLLSSWHTATPGMVGLVAGIELLSGGLSMAGSSAVVWRHPDESPYDGRDDQVMRATVRASAEAPEERPRSTV
jgi:hypothetical protein